MAQQQQSSSGSPSNTISQGQKDLASLLRSSIGANSSSLLSTTQEETSEAVMSSLDETKFQEQRRNSSTRTYSAASSSTSASKSESAKKLRVTFRDSTDSQGTDDSTSSQNTVIEGPGGSVEGGISESVPVLSSKPPIKETMFEKLKKELLSGALDVVQVDDQTAAQLGGIPRVTVLRRGSFTPSTMTLTRSMSTTNSSITDQPAVKSVSFAQSITAGGDVVAKELRVAYHKRQASLNGSEPASTPTTPQGGPEKPPGPEQKIVVATEKPGEQQVSRTQSPPTNKGTLPDLEAMPAMMKQLIAHFMAANNDSQLADLAGKMAAILEQAWNRGGPRGIDIAESMCRDIRLEGALSLAFSLAASNTTTLRELRLNTYRLLVSSFSSENRVWITNQVKDGKVGSGSKKQQSPPNMAKEPGELDALFSHAAEALRKASSPSSFDPEMCLAGFGIVRSLLAHSNETCCTALDNGVMEAVSCGLRTLPSILTSSPSTELNQIQSTLSASIATMATLLQSAPHHQQVVNQANAVDRLLLPICTAEDNPVAQYFGLLSAVSFHRFEGNADDPSSSATTRRTTDDQAVRATMAQFLNKAGNSPAAFPFGACSLLVRRGPMSIAVKPEIWLKRFLDTAVESSPGKVGFAPEIQGMALFHIAVELERVLGSGLVDDFVRSPQFTQPLLKIAESPNSYANRIAAGLLTKIGARPGSSNQIHSISNRVPAWTALEVRRWLTSCVGLALDEEAKQATEILDGDLLLTMPLVDVRQSLFSHSSNKAKLALFARHLTHLKLLADYTSYDPSDMDGWLSQISPQLRQYTYTLLHAGVDRHFAIKGCLDETILTTDCGITNGVHRQLILSSSGYGFANDQALKTVQTTKQTIEISTTRKPSTKWLYDVFICYKRASGSQLASLLKVYLELRGFRVFLDVTDLSSGRCFDRLVETINASRHFLLILTGGCFDSIIGDEDRSDWVHREIYAALQAACNIIPIADHFFSWPSSPSSLPADIRSIMGLNTIKWLHDYQDACIDRIEKFMIDHVNANKFIEKNSVKDDDAFNNEPENKQASIRPPPPTTPSTPSITTPILNNSTQQPVARKITASSPAEFLGRGVNNPHNAPSPVSPAANLAAYKSY